MFQCRVCQVHCSLFSKKNLCKPSVTSLFSSAVQGWCFTGRDCRDGCLLDGTLATGNTRIIKYIGVRANASELFHYTDLDRQIMPHKQNMHHNKYQKRYPKRQTQHNKQPIRETDRQTNQPTDRQTQKWEKLTVVNQLIWGVGIAAVLITGEAFCK